MKPLILPLPPSTNNLYSNARQRGKGRVLNKEGRQYKETARMLAYGARLPLLRGDVRFEMTVYFANRRRRDLSNCLKIVEDSLKGIAYVDDSQVSEIVLRRAFDARNPRAEVWIDAMIRAEAA